MSVSFAPSENRSLQTSRRFRRAQAAFAHPARVKATTQIRSALLLADLQYLVSSCIRLSTCVCNGRLRGSSFPLPWRTARRFRRSASACDPGIHKTFAGCKRHRFRRGADPLPKTSVIAKLVFNVRIVLHIRGTNIVVAFRPCGGACLQCLQRVGSHVTALVTMLSRACRFV